MGSAEIKLELQRVSNNLVRADVFANNLPQNFLGLSCHLSISGVDWHLKSQELGTGLDNLLFLVSEKHVSEKEGELILGLSQKVNEIIFVPEGKIFTVFLKMPAQGNTLFQFNHLKLFTYNNGIKSEVPITSRDFSIDLQQISSESQINNNSNAPQLLTGPTILSQENAIFSNQGVATYYEFIAIGVLVLLVIFVLFYKYIKNKS